MGRRVIAYYNPGWILLIIGWLGWVELGVSKPTEMTIRDLLQEELRKRGVAVVPEFSVSTPDGRRMMPDMYVFRRDVKWLARKRKLKRNCIINKDSSW